MKGLKAFVRKNLKQNSSRTLVTIVGIILTCILMFGLGFGFTTFLNKKNDEVIYNVGKYHFAYEDIDVSHLSKIKKDENLDSIEVEGLLKEYKIGHYSVRLFARNHYELSSISILKGKFPSKEGEILLDTVISKYYQKDIGDTVEIEGELYTIVGFYESSSSYLEHASYTYKENINTDTVSIYMTLKNPKDAYLKIHTLSETLGFKIVKYQNGLYYEHEKTNDSLLQTLGEYRSYLDYASMILVLMILLLVLSIVCILVIYNAFAISVTERKKTLGVLSSIGATPGQLLKSVFYEASIVGGIAIPIGFITTFVLAYFLVWIGNHVFYEILEVPLRLGIHPMYFIICLIFILITIYLSAFFPAMRAREVTPIEAIRMQQDIHIKRKKIKSGKWVRKLLGIEGEIAYKNRKRNKKRYRIVTLSLIIGIVLFMSFSAYLDVQKKVVQKNQEDMGDFYDTITVALSGNEELKKEYIDALLDGVEVTKITKYRGIITKLDKSLLPPFNKEFEKKYPTFQYVQLVAIEDEKYHNYLKQIGEKSEKPIFRNYLYYNNPESKQETRIKMFDSIDKLPLILTDYSSKGSTSLIVDDFYIVEESLEEEEGMYPSLYVPESLYLKWILKSDDITYQDEGLKTSYSILTDDFRKIEQNYQALKEPYATLYVSYSNERYSNYQNELYLKVWNYMVFGVIAFLGLIAITSVINTINTSMRLRKKEFAMLRSIGMTSKQFYKMICLESFFFGLTSLVIGLLLSSGIIYLLHQAMNVGRLEEEVIHYPFPFGYMIITIVFVFIIVLIAMLYSTRKVKHDNIVDVLKEDSF